MASAFPSGPSAKCQGADCEGGEAVATYSITELQDLCDDCISRKGLAVRLDDQSEWRCEKHRKAIEFVCRSHGLPLCQSCAFLSHQKPCVVQDLEDAVGEKRSKLEMLRPKVAEKQNELRRNDSQVKEIGSRLEQHFKSVKNDIERAASNEIKLIDVWEADEVGRLRKEADEQIREIEEQFDIEKQKRRQVAMTKREDIKSGHERLAEDLASVEKRVIATINNVTSHLNAVKASIEEAERRLRRLALNDRDLVYEAEALKESLKTTLDADVNVEALDRAARRGLKIHFKEADSFRESGVSGTEESWDLIEKVAIGENVVKPYFIGALDEERMVVSDIACRTLYVTNLKKKTTTKVLERSGDYRKVVSCSSFGKGSILCGNFCKNATGNTFRGASLYNGQWEFIRDVELPKNPDVEKTFASVHIDKSGRILAAVACQSEVHVINPGNGKVTHSVKTGADKIQWLCSLPSGNFMAKTGSCEFTLVDPSGVHQACVRSDRWDGCLCDVDMSDGSIYVVYRDKERMVYTMDVLTSEGDLEATRVVEYPISKNRKDVVLPCIVTSSGKLITCNGENFFIFDRS